MKSTWSTVATVLLIAVCNATAYRDVYMSDETRAELDENSLPKYLTPTSYKLKLVPRISDGYFNGSAEIITVCNASTDTIVLHAHKDLNISSNKITTSDTVALSITGITRNVTDDTLTIITAEKLQQGQTYKLYFEFNGTLRTVDTDYWRDRNDGGFYIGNYENTEKKKTSWYAVTTMYPNFARRIFPCFDEPAFKATFQISVARPTNMSTLSVMPVESTELHEEKGLVWDHFPATPLLTTFSVNILVTDIDSFHPVDISSSMGEFQMKIYSRENRFTKDLPDNTKLIPDMLCYIQEYLQVSYPLSKLDIVALPGFSITSTQLYTMGLLILPEYSINDNYPELKIGLINQWTSNLVTPHDWSSFNITYIINSFLMDRIAANVSNSQHWIQGSSQRQYYTYSRSFNRTQFDEFSLYEASRGEWLLQMLSYVLGNSTIINALGKFITKNKFGSVNERQLWKAMTQEAWSVGSLATSLTVEEIVDTWLHNNLYRYPVLTIIRNYQEESASVEQHTFTSELPRNLTPEEEKHLWMVPITYLTNKDMDTSTPNQATWIRDRELTITNLPDYNSFIIVNPTDAGMFLVNYDRHNWELIIQSLLDSSPQIPAVTRMKLLNDALLLAMGGELDYITALNITLFLRNEKEYKVWNSMLENFDNLETLYLYSPVEENLNTYVRKTMKHLMDESVGEPDYDSDAEYTMFWYNTRTIYNKLGNQQRIDEAHRRLDDIMPTFTVNDDKGLVLFCPEFMKNSSANWSENTEKLQDYLNEFYESKQFLERSFAKCPGYTIMIQRLLDGLLDEDMIFTSGRWEQMINMLTSSEKAQNMTFTYFMDNYHELKKKFYFMKDMWSSLVSGITSKVRTEQGLNKLVELYDHNKGKLGYAETILESSIKEVQKAEIGRAHV